MWTQLHLEETGTGVRVTNYPGWPGWTFEVGVDVWGSGEVGEVTPIAPIGSRRNVKLPDDKARERVRRQVGRQFLDGIEGMIELAAMALPHPVGSRDKRQRAQAAAVIYSLALKQGYWPRPVIAKVFGLPFTQVHNAQGELVDDENHPSNTVDKLIREAREYGFLPPYDPTRDVPVLWPIGDQAERLQEPGRVLTLHWKPQPPITTDANGRQVVDLEVVGRWSDGEDLPRMEPLREVAMPEHMQRLFALISDMEAKFPGTRVRAKYSVP